VPDCANVLLCLPRIPFTVPAPARLCAAAFACLLAGAAALCGAQTPPTSDEPAAVTAPAPPPPTVVPERPAQFGPPPPNSGTLPPRIALVLPLETPAYARAADAVRLGFLAAADVAGMRDKVIVIGHRDDGVVPAFDAARDRGATVIVGPLVRDDLKTLAIAGGEWPKTIALNQLEDATALPANTWSLALTVESDARVLARRALRDGVKAIDIVEGESPLMRRMASAFASEWTTGGGAPPAGYAIDPSPDSLIALRKSLTKALPDAVVLALDGERAAQVKPYVSVPAYASGLTFERPPPAVARDLDDVRVVDIPLILTPDAPELARLPRRELASAALTRLYALGLDAFRVAEAFMDVPPERLEFDGAIGHLTLDGRQFLREGRLGVYRDGQLVPLEPAR
jgi:outer membrane PBP1 activator LpoA protein